MQYDIIKFVAGAVVVVCIIYIDCVCAEKKRLLVESSRFILNNEAPSLAVL